MIAKRFSDGGYDLGVSIIFITRQMRKITLPKGPVWIPDAYVDPAEEGVGFYSVIHPIYDKKGFFGSRIDSYCG